MNSSTMTLFDHLSDAERVVLFERARRLNQISNSSITEQFEAVVVRFHFEQYAFALADLQAVLRSNITALPGVNPMVAGLINVRGELISVLELHLLLGLPSPDLTDPCVLLVKCSHGLVGLRVPDLPELMLLAAELTPGLSNRSGVQGVLEGKIVLLEIEGLLQNLG